MNRIIEEELMKASNEKYEQMEFESIVNPIDDKEAEKRHRDNLWRRWFKMYRLCKDENKKRILIDQYNKLATQRSRQ